MEHERQTRPPDLWDDELRTLMEMTARPPIGMAVTTTRPHPPHARLGTSALASLIPCAGFIAAVEVAVLSVENKSTSLGGHIASAPLYLAFVALPSLLPIAVARRGLMWISVVIVMSAVAVAAGIAVATTDDAQAGLAVLWVPFVAEPPPPVRATRNPPRLPVCRSGSRRSRSTRSSWARCWWFP
jgi:hypothetical protein